MEIKKKNKKIKNRIKVIYDVKFILFILIY